MPEIAADMIACLSKDVYHKWGLTSQIFDAFEPPEVHYLTISPLQNKLQVDCSILWLSMCDIGPQNRGWKRNNKYGIFSVRTFGIKLTILRFPRENNESKWARLLKSKNEYRTNFQWWITQKDNFLSLEVSFELQSECTILHAETWKAVENFRPCPHVSGNFFFRKYFFADTKIFASTRSIFKWFGIRLYPEMNMRIIPILASFLPRHSYCKV